MFSKLKKSKKKYSDSKLHFIVFLTSKKPINLSISKWVVYSALCVLILSAVVISVFSYNTYTLNENLSSNLSALEEQIVKLQVDNLKLGEENTSLKGSLDEKTVKVSNALQELEALQGSIKEIKEIVGLPVEDEEATTKITTTTTTTTQSSAVQTTTNLPSSRSMNILRNYDVQATIQPYIPENNDKKYENIEKLLDETKEELELLLASAEERKQYLEDAPIFFPTNGRITSNFGARWGSVHRGVDISNNVGTKIYASGNGVVKESRYGYSYGNYVLIQHANGFETRYAHLSKRLVKVGAEVKQGELIGLMGNTGTSYGSHLHYEIYLYDKLIDPLKIENYLKYKE